MAEPGMEITRGCWVDLFDAPAFSGKIRRVFGPALHSHFRADNSNPFVPVASLIVGPNAYVQLLTQRRPERILAWLVPGQRIADLSAMKSDQSFESIRLLNRPPLEHERGYNAYARQVGKQQTEPSRHRHRRRRERRK